MSSVCGTFEAQLAPFMDGELPDTDAASVREHLAACEPCRQVVAAHERVRARLQNAQLPALAPGMAEQLLARARVPGFGWGQVAAAVVLAVLVPAAVAVAAPKIRSLAPTCNCDTVSPDLDLGL